MWMDSRRRGCVVKNLVETPEGKGRLVGAAEVPGGWRVRVELSGGGTWTGSSGELLGAGDAETIRSFLRELGGRQQEE